MDKHKIVVTFIVGQVDSDKEKLALIIKQAAYTVRHLGFVSLNEPLGIFDQVATEETDSFRHVLERYVAVCRKKSRKLTHILIVGEMSETNIDSLQEMSDLQVVYMKSDMPETDSSDMLERWRKHQATVTPAIGRLTLMPHRVLILEKNLFFDQQVEQVIRGMGFKRDLQEYVLSNVRQANHPARLSVLRVMKLRRKKAESEIQPEPQTEQEPELRTESRITPSEEAQILSPVVVAPLPPPHVCESLSKKVSARRSHARPTISALND